LGIGKLHGKGLLSVKGRSRNESSFSMELGVIVYT